LGPEARETAIADAWRTLLPLIPRLLAREPRRIAASVSNAAHQIGNCAGARPHDWILAMSAIGPQCEDAATFLESGKVAAWLAGRPQYRQAALKILRSLPLSISTSLLRLDSQADRISLEKTIDVMAENRWLSAADAAAGLDLTRIRVVCRAGDFRGFAGTFLRPPIVATQDSQLLVTDGEIVWTLIADAYGNALHRTPFSGFAPENSVAPLKFSAGGELIWDTVTTTLPDLAKWSSAAFDGQTLAVTLPTSHHIFLVARG
jgi:hypothetical protein